MYIRAKKYYKIISLLIMVLLITGCSQSKDETTQGPTDNTSAEVNQSDTNPDSSPDAESDVNSDTDGVAQAGSDETDSDEAEELIDAQVLSYNEPIVTNIFTADPSAHVFNGTLYIYPSHDPDYIDPNTSSQDGGQYLMEDYHVLTITDFDSECVDNGEALNLRDVPWAKQQLWAPDAAYKNGMYYLYFPAKDQEDIFRMGVATSSEPTGPFVAEPDYIEGSYSIDPAVFT
ncbi:MAG: family 43 glycosylhydrolase, partial [Vallitaleaceae bacterium]|nr:family 43 glycosylhydrolase [Vallitaleaceae bacterium]